MKKILLSLLLSTSVFADSNTVIKDNLSLWVSQKSVDMIIYYEVGGRSYYNKNFLKPVVPAWQTTQSGVTIGFGFDCGFNTKDEIKKATVNILSNSEIELLQSVSGLKGKSAYYNGLPKVKHKVNVTYEEAEQIFFRDSLPRFTKQTATAFNLTPTRLHPHSNGALTSLVYNRGPSTSNTNSRKEMRDIKNHIASKQDDKVPGDIRAMKRLWDYNKLKGLHLRRDAEANLFREGLNQR